MTPVRAGDTFAVYGLLRRGASGFAQFGLATAFRALGPCRIPGAIHDLGGYPGLVAGSGTVMGELFEVLDPSVIARLDSFEDYDPAAPGSSRYLRVRLRLLEPDVEAWIYVWNQPVDGCPRVDSGDWLAWASQS